MFALFRDGQQIGKTFPTREQAAVEAYEMRLVVDAGTDFPGDVGGRYLCDGVEIREVE